MKPKRVAIIAEWLTSRGGAENVIFELLRIFPQADLFTTVANRQLFPELKERKVVTSFLQKIPIINKKHQLALFLLPKAIQSLNLNGYELIISSSSAFGKGIKKPKDAFHICYCHTPMRWVWEPERDNRLSQLPLSKLIINYLKKWDLKTNYNVDLFLANSKNTANKIKKFYSADAKILYPPVSIDLFCRYKTKKKKTNRKNYYFSISRLITYKRIDIAILACRTLKRKLLIAGDGPEKKRLKKIADDNIEFLGEINQKEKAELFSDAKATIFCADEDFGIVPVESLACGTPVIGYKKGGILEVVEDKKTGLLFEEQTPQSLAKKIIEFEKMKFFPPTLSQSVKKFDRINFENKLLKIIKEIRS